MFYVRGLNGHHAIRTWKVAIAAWLLLSGRAADAARAVAMVRAAKPRIVLEPGYLPPAPVMP